MQSFIMFTKTVQTQKGANNFELNIGQNFRFKNFV